VAFRAEAVQVEPQTARLGRLAPVESLLPASGQAASSAGECPGYDDVLGFCAGTLGPERSVFVQRHLDTCPACMDLVTLAINDWEPREPPRWLDVASNFQPGDRVDDRFVIRRFLGCGGMGEVYEAVDTQSSTRVALKAVLAACSDNPYILRCFRREARLGRTLRHPNVCRVHHSAGHRPAARKAPVPYFTMEFIEGETLHERLRRAPLSLDETLAIARELLVGLRAIHRAGVLHLDIKSSNIMLRRGQPQKPVILDFGLARRASRSRRERVRPLTGSLAYMPPEQILGRVPDVQNDLFAFGVVLFHMLTRELPFPAAQPSMASSIVQRLTAHAPRPSELVPTVPAWLDQVVFTCLADPDHRYSDAQALLEVLEEGHGARDPSACLDSSEAVHDETW
jgi:serine/threonine protein kinase